MIFLSLAPNGVPENKIMFALLIFAIGGPFHHLNTTLGNFIMIIGVFYFLYTLITYKKEQKGFYSYSFIYTLLVVYILIITLRMFLADGKNSFWGINASATMRTLFLQMEFIPNLLPLSLLLFRNNKALDIRYYLKISKILLVLFLCFSPLAIHHMLNYDWSGRIHSMAGEEWGDEGTYGDFIMNSSLSLSSLAPPIIMVYFSRYQKRMLWCFYLLSSLIVLFIYIYTARRGGIALEIVYLTTCFFLYLMQSKGKKYSYILFLFIVGYLLYSIYLSIDEAFFSLVMERGVEDTRSGVEDNFYKDMDPLSWLIGKSWFGSYYDPLFMKYRTSIETGYLAFILRGGILYLALYLLVLIPSAITGYFKSNNILVKSFALMILLHIVELYPFGWPDFTMKYFTVWIGVYVCRMQYYRKLTDKEIFKLYFKE